MAASSAESSAAVAILHSPRSPLSASSVSSDHPQKANPSSSGNISPKKAWRQRSPANGTPVPTATIEAGPVIGGPESWPALSESASKVVTKPSPKASDASSGSPSPPPTHQRQMASSPSKSSSGNSGPNRAAQPRPKPARRNNTLNLANGSSGSMHSPFTGTGSPAGSFHPNPVSEASWGGDSNNVSSNSFNGSRNPSGSHNTNYRRGGFTGNKWRGNGGGAYNNGGRRNQESFDGYHRSQHRGYPPHFLRAPLQPIGAPPPPPPPFIGTSQPHPSFVAPIPDMPASVYLLPMPSPEGMRGMPFVVPPVASPAFIFPPLDPQREVLLGQIHYYFSPENLCKDTYLRKNMDAQGWVPISLIANFNKVKEITNNLQFIIDTLQYSTVVEIQGDRMRKRDNWKAWLLPPEQTSFVDTLPSGQSQITHVQQRELEGNISNPLPSQGEASISRSTSDD